MVNVGGLHDRFRPRGPDSFTIVALVARVVTFLGLAETARDLGGPVGQDDVGASAADRRQVLHDHPLAI